MAGPIPRSSNVGEVSLDAGPGALVVHAGETVVLRAYDGGITLIPATGPVIVLASSAAVGSEGTTRERQLWAEDKTP